MSGNLRSPIIGEARGASLTQYRTGKHLVLHQKLEGAIKILAAASGRNPEGHLATVFLADGAPLVQT